jgi:hypothetical protein
MKHLRKYNESNSDFYTPVDFRTYHEHDPESWSGKRSTTIVQLTQNEVNFIGKLSKSHGRGRWLCEFNFEGNKSVFVSKDSDDWFWVRVWKGLNPSYYYKCDQIEGVAKLIEDVMFNNVKQSRLFN